MFKALTFSELLCVRKALQQHTPTAERTRLLLKVNEELAVRKFPSIVAIDQSSRQTQ